MLLGTYYAQNYATIIGGSLEKVQRTAACYTMNDYPWRNCNTAMINAPIKLIMLINDLIDVPSISLTPMFTSTRDHFYINAIC